MATDNTGTPNSPYDAVTVETIAGEIQAGPHNTNYSNLDAAAEGHTHPLDGQVGWDAFKANCDPLDGIDTANRWGLLSGTTTVTLASGTKQFTITFSTDADQSNSGFLAGGSGTRIIPTCRSATKECSVTVDSANRLGGTLTVTEINGGTSNSNVAIDWIAIGQVA